MTAPKTDWATSPAGWLSPTTGRPPLPRREATPLYEQALTAAAHIREDLEARESTAVLYRVEELNRVLEPEWPVEVPVEDGTVPSLPRAVAPPVAVKPRRWSRQWWVENLSLSRVVWGGSSAVVLLATGLGWIQ